MNKVVQIGQTGLPDESAFPAGRPLWGLLSVDEQIFL